MRELGAVDDDDARRARPRPPRRPCRRCAAGSWAAGRGWRRGPITATSSIGNCETRPCCGHLRAADAEVADAAAPALVQRRHQLGAERVARMLAGDHEQAQVLPLGRIGISRMPSSSEVIAMTLRSAHPAPSYPAQHQEQPVIVGKPGRLLVGRERVGRARSRQCRPSPAPRPVASKRLERARFHAPAPRPGAPARRPCASAGPIAAAPPPARAWP